MSWFHDYLLPWGAFIINMPNFPPIEAELYNSQPIGGRVEFASLPRLHEVDDVLEK